MSSNPEKMSWIPVLVIELWHTEFGQNRANFEISKSIPIETPISRVWRVLDLSCKVCIVVLGELVPTRYHLTHYLY